MPARVSISASQDQVESGFSVELRWVASDALSASIEPGIGAVDPGGGSLRVRPLASTTYRITVQGAPGTTPESDSATVQVNARARRSLLPPNRTELELAMEAASDRRPELPIRKLWSAEDCPAALLPYLAWALSVEEWDSDWPQSLKRLAVSRAFRVHKLKGTVAGLKLVMDDAGADYEYEERPGGAAMTARLSIYNSNAVFLPDIAEAVGRVKRASLDLEIVLASALEGEIPIGAGLGAATVVKMENWTGYGV